jgi:inorganic pyrophosphatase
MPESRAPSPRRALKRLGPFDGRTSINVVVETPKGRRNKYRYEPALGVFRLGKVLPAGAAFPYDFGFIPGTMAEDGDPLDVLLLMDESAYPGCLVVARPIGVLEAEQTEDGETVRNDRIVAVAKESHDHRHIRSLRDLNATLRGELEHFFKSYNEAQGREFQILAARGPRRALSLIRSCALRSKSKRPR